jgi:outer membrane protein assembly factor BamB
VVVPTVDQGVLAFAPPADTTGYPPSTATRLWRIPSDVPVLSPVVRWGEDLALTAADDGAIYLLDAVHGGRIETPSLPGMIRLRPAVCGDRALVADGWGQVVALDRTGRELWRRDLGATVTVGLAAGNTSCYLGTAEGSLVGLRVRDGRVFWRHRLPGPAAGSLQVTESLVLVGLRDGRIVAFERPPEP